MAARCASCGEGIRKGQPIKIAGTEVFHPECVGELATSRTHRLAKKTLDQRLEISRLRHDLEVAREQLRRQETHADNADQRARFVENEVAGLRRILSIAQDIKTSDDIVIARLQRDLTIANATGQSARSELALLRTLAQPAPQPTVVRQMTEQIAEPAPDGDKAPEDDLVIRASLLELD
jgi:hypothetical protein